MKKKHKKKLYKVAYLSEISETRPVSEHVTVALAKYLEKTGKRLEKGKATSEKEYDAFKEVAHLMLDLIKFSPRQ